MHTDSSNLGYNKKEIFLEILESGSIETVFQPKVSLVNELINNDNALPGFCITEDDDVLGIITRNSLHLKLSGLYGYSLYANKAIKIIMNRDFMCVDYKTPIDVVSKIAMQREPDKLYDFITVTKDCKYYGIVTIKDLLEKTIEMEVLNAKHLNPLTELPGNLLIEKYLEHCLKADKNFWVLYFDIDNFKAYNDVYGFEKGDLVIKNVAEILKKDISGDEFIGHIGGDDFIAVLFNSENIEGLCKGIIKKFESMLVNYYNKNDIHNGYIKAKNRKGIEESFPLLSISIAGIYSENYNNIFEISKKASEVKKSCKQMTGSNFLLMYI